MSSDIRVYVRWKEQSFFAGEDLECTITFKNVANPRENLPLGNAAWPSRRRESIHASQGMPSVSEHRLSPSTTSRVSSQFNGNGTNRQHRKAGSLNLSTTPITSPRSPLYSPGIVPNLQSPRQHQRSISIVSIGSGDVGKGTTQPTRMLPPIRPSSKHNRSASAQVLPKDTERTSTTRNSVSYGSYQPQTDQSASENGPGDVVRLKLPRSSSQRGSRASSSSTSPIPTRKSSPLANSSFKFPPQPQEGETRDSTKAVRSSDAEKITGVSTSKTRPSDQAKLAARQDAPLTSRILSGVSVDDNARDSGEFYSASNLSTDTLASEQVPLSKQRLLQADQQNGRLPSFRKPKPIKLLMGYAQISATFLVDATLVDQSQFEEVKRKGFLGGQGGGGVVGVETPRAGTGLFGGFSLSGISESIGGLLGGTELSSTKEMKGVTTSRTVPLLSTPQSLLFVDLQLDPGEEKSVGFAYPLPRGLPGAHKGKAIKTSYNLVIGTQWAPAQEKMQRISQINVPFRVFSGVNGENISPLLDEANVSKADGQILGHDLMQPYVILQDQGRTQSIIPGSNPNQDQPAKTSQSQQKFASTFLSYTSGMLSPKYRRASSTPTLSHVLPTTMKEAIDHAILLSNQSSSSKSPNHFSITRSARRVGSITLNRPLHRLGETISANVDFAAGQISCFSLRCMLETVEKVDPSLALRSTASITRVTRRIHASQVENTLFAKRVAFMPTIPTYMAPTLLTSGIELEWRLRFEFVTAKANEMEQELQPEELGPYDVLEEIARDERGVALAAVEAMACETFEVVIPITVFGDAAQSSGEEEEAVGYPI